jgi:hypothetical protein
VDAPVRIFDFMNLTNEQIQEMKQAALPLMQWLEKNCHPHVKAIVDSERTEVVEGLASVLKRHHFDE